MKMISTTDFNKIRILRGIPEHELYYEALISYFIISICSLLVATKNHLSQSVYAGGEPTWALINSNARTTVLDMSA